MCKILVQKIKYAQKTANLAEKIQRHAFCICIYQKKVVPLHPILYIGVLGLNG